MHRAAHRPNRVVPSDGKTCTRPECAHDRRKKMQKRKKCIQSYFCFVLFFIFWLPPIRCDRNNSNCLNRHSVQCLVFFAMFTIYVLAHKCYHNDRLEVYCIYCIVLCCAVSRAQTKEWMKCAVSDRWKHDNNVDEKELVNGCLRRATKEDRSIAEH